MDGKVSCWHTIKPMTQSSNITTLAYHPDTSLLFDRLAYLPYAIWLDSCHPLCQQGRYDIISAEPSIVINHHEHRNFIETSDELRISNTDLFQLVKEYLATFKPLAHNLPFSHGALGYFGYDIGRELEHLENRLDNDIQLPDAFIGFYDWSIIVDHQAQKTYLVNRKQLPEYKKIKQRLFEFTKPFKPNISKQSYQSHFNRLIDHIAWGDIYEVNYTQRFSAEFHGDPYQLYKKLRLQAATPFAAFINHPKGAILSFSPERFVEVRNQVATTQPIKGTIARQADPEQDQQAQQELKASEKDQAENLMIVDLMRNDFGKVCSPGSIEAPKLFELQSFPNVHHLVSTITGHLPEETHALDLLRACFPGGSITGAPKIAAMEKIEQHEAQRRSVYCGSIGYWDANGDMDCNIAIRTLICDGNRIHAYSGGALVMDSECELEHAESLAKINNLLGEIPRN